MATAVAGSDLGAGTSIGAKDGGNAMQRSGAGVVMVYSPVANGLKHQEFSCHDLACILSPIYSYQAGLTSESSEYSVTAATRNAQGACD